MILTKDWHALIERLLDPSIDDFESLVKSAGLDPARDFRGADLRGVDFGQADLGGYDFSGADLRGADASRAVLDGAIFTGARLDTARLRQIPIAPQPTYGPFHRLKSATQNKTLALSQRKTGLLVGLGSSRHTGRGFFPVPSVNAYVGPLPATAEGIEFITTARPLAHLPSIGSLARWSFDSRGVVCVDQGFPAIPVTVTKIVYSDLKSADLGGQDDNTS